MLIKEKLDYQSRPKPITFLATDTVKHALDVMCEKNIGSIVVVDDHNHVLGIVTERDMMIRVLGPAIDVHRTVLADIMTQDVKVANETDELIDWLQTMSNERFRHLPIVNESGHLVALLSQGDFVAYTWPELYDKLRKDIKGRLEHIFPVAMVAFAVLTLVFIALQY